jgi:pyridoxamine 5'-phosphate oxidase
MSSLRDHRTDYRLAVLDVATLGDDPIAALARWIDEALDAGAAEPTAMTLATVDADGSPSARVVLCKGVSADGLRFYTNYDSRKGEALAHEPRAALCFFWPALERQARVEGKVTRVSREESEQYFHSRPRGSQIAALASRQSHELADREALVAEVERLEKAHPDEVPLPESWGGYVLAPTRIEFWQGRPSRLHDRVVFTRDGDEAWRVARLAP